MYAHADGAEGLPWLPQNIHRLYHTAGGDLTSYFCALFLFLVIICGCTLLLIIFAQAELLLIIFAQAELLLIIFAQTELLLVIRAL